MSKKIELKPIPLNPILEKRKSTDAEMQTNPVSKRDLFNEE
jgi:hypothetical protein